LCTIGFGLDALFFIVVIVESVKEGMGYMDEERGK